MRAQSPSRKPGSFRIPARPLALGLLLTAFSTLAFGLGGWVLVMKDKDAVERLAYIKKKVRQEFPAAPQLQTETLARRLAAGEAVVLLDVRSPEEYAVSHLPGALRVDPSAEPRLPPGVDPELPVIAYCSVGWRSSKWVEGLRRAGVDAVNLEGSIFQWVAEGRPLVRAEEPVTVVHPYGRAWAWLVDPEHRAFTPNPG